MGVTDSPEAEAVSEAVSVAVAQASVEEADSVAVVLAATVSFKAAVALLA